MAGRNKPINQTAMKELVAATQAAQGIQECLEAIAYQLELLSEHLGNPVHVILAPSNTIPLDQCDADVQMAGLDALGCIVHSASNSPEDIIAVLQKLTSFGRQRSRPQK